MTDQTTEVIYCANHPDTETSLRCNRCNKPICTRCAVLTPTGYRCRECVRGQQKAFETAEWYDYPLAFTLAAVLSFLGSLIAGVLGFFIIFLAPVAGGIIAEVIRVAIRRHRSKRLYQMATLGAIAGSLPRLLIVLLPVFLSFGSGSLGGLGYFLPLIWQAVYTFIVASTLYYRLGGISM